jgi:molybdenum cofactor cytidylyltransferase
MSVSENRRIGVIVAAGRGRRMGRTKQLVPWRTAAGEKPLVAAAYDAIRDACDEMVVVLGHEADTVAMALGDRAFQRVPSDSDGPMFASIRTGLVAAHAINRDATVVLQPGDHPEVAPATLLALIAAATAHPDRAIIPQYQGRGGHPVMIPPLVVALLLKSDCPAGLARFWNDHPAHVRRVPVDDAAVILDIDTAAQLRRPL